MNELEQAIARAIADKKILTTPTLKAFAIAFNTNPVRIYTVAKEPKAGIMYDARVINWDAVERFCIKRLDPDTGLATLDDLVNLAIRSEQDLRLKDRRTKLKDSSGGVVLNGRVVPNRKIAIDLGNVVQFKDDTHKYKVVYLTDSHVVMTVDDTSELVCFGNWTFNNKLEVVVT
jgi:hypothetical protein